MVIKKIHQNIKKKIPPGLVFLKTFLICILILILIVLVNANILYFLTIGPNIINKWFPTNCKDYPFGNGSNNPCASMMNWNISKICLPIIGGGLEDNNNPGIFHKLFFGSGDNLKPAFPYKYYDKNNPDTIRDYLNWIISGLAKTNIKLNELLSSIFTNETLRQCPSSLIILFGSILLLILPFIFIFSLGGNVFFKTMGIFNTELITKMFIFLSVITGSTLILDFIFGIIAAISLFMILLFGPLLVDRKNFIIGIIKEIKLVSFLLGASFLIALFATPVNENIPGNLIKGIVGSLYFIFLIISIIVSMTKKI